MGFNLINVKKIKTSGLWCIIILKRLSKVYLEISGFL